MKTLSSAVILLASLWIASAHANELALTWGLENEWAYRETQRPRWIDGEPDSSTMYRAFAFNEGKSEVREPWLACLDRHFELWDRYSASGGETSRAAFTQYKREQDQSCTIQLRKTAPVLYFDFVADTDDQYVLEQIEITTLQFSEYRGGGFFDGEAWYDILLTHEEGVKVHKVERRLVFKGHGRAELRFWSDNFYPSQGWIAPMGEYLLDIRFVFSAAGTTISVETGPFKMDV